jgi:hypothetical protein
VARHYRSSRSPPRVLNPGISPGFYRLQSGAHRLTSFHLESSWPIRKLSTNGRCLREADNRSRRFASFGKPSLRILEFMAGGLFGDLRPQRDSERGSLCTRRTTPPAAFRGRPMSWRPSGRSLGEKLMRTRLDYRGGITNSLSAVPHPMIINQIRSLDVVHHQSSPRAVKSFSVWCGLLRGYRIENIRVIQRG